MLWGEWNAGTRGLAWFLITYEAVDLSFDVTVDGKGKVGQGGFIPLEKPSMQPFLSTQHHLLLQSESSFPSQASSSLSSPHTTQRPSHRPASSSRPRSRKSHLQRLLAPHLHQQCPPLRPGRCYGSFFGRLRPAPKHRKQQGVQIQLSISLTGCAETDAMARLG